MVITKWQLIKTEAAAGDAAGLTSGMRRAYFFIQRPTTAGMFSACTRACARSRKKSTAVVDQKITARVPAGRTCVLRILSGIVLAAVLSAPAGAQTIQLRAELDNPIGITIPSNFVGFSIDLFDVENGVPTPQNPTLISLIQLLGPNGVMRVGGNATDNVPADTVTQDMVNQTAAFLSSLGPGWNVLYDLDAAVNDPNLAVTIAGYWLNALGSNLVAFQVGNEPDFQLGSEQRWLDVFNTYYQALTDAYGALNYGAPDTSGMDGLSWPGDTLLGAGGFQYLTFHKYSLGCNPEPLPSAGAVLADAVVPSEPGWSLAEFGIICHGGMQGVTDRLIAATYYLRLAQSATLGGYTSILPENAITPQLWNDGKVRPAYYSQFIVEPDGGYAPTPMFYGMFLFSQIVGQQIIGIQTPRDYSSVASMLATQSPNGNANILVVNINPRRGFYVRPDQTHPWSSANVLLLSGTSCADPEPVLNGYPIGEGGSWNGSVATLNQGQSVFVPPCGAALIEIQATS